MSIVGILGLALAVAMDATAVAAARGLAAPRVRLRHALLVGGLFGGAQALMPLLGWAVGDRVGPLVARWDHWVVFALLGGIGAKMLWEARAVRTGPTGPEGRNRSHRRDPFGLGPLLLLALATSIDAFGVGITLPMLGAPLATSILVFGLTTALLSAAALFAARQLGGRFGGALDALGGLILIGVGAHIVIQHLRAR